MTDFAVALGWLVAAGFVVAYTEGRSVSPSTTTVTVGWLFAAITGVMVAVVIGIGRVARHRIHLGVRDAEEALRVANSTRYGLAASVFTSRAELAHRFAAGIESGMVHLNHGTASQAHVPFGGRKDSGAGAFSIGPTARDFFTAVKVIYSRW
ncbi:MAG TPA: aldehyde dehydrogenase family protein [Acidimicrobiales bacterium]|nr:aldehyde dehydrogenase family protein [Acidimicrobiales bacterium]